VRVLQAGINIGAPTISALVVLHRKHLVIDHSRRCETAGQLDPSWVRIPAFSGVLTVESPCSTSSTRNGAASVATSGVCRESTGDRLLRAECDLALREIGW